MDNYPEALAPEFNEGGGVATPFDEWWARVRKDFPHVPEEVAKYWLHEHWSHSPFAWLPSRQLRFERVEWPLENLLAIRSRWCDYTEDNLGCIEHGRYLLNLPRYRTSAFMKEHQRPPAPVIVLDNRKGRFTAGDGLVPEREGDLPAAYILVEGHRRFNLALALHEKGQLASFPVWLIRPIELDAGHPER